MPKRNLDDGMGGLGPKRSRPSKPKGVKRDSATGHYTSLSNTRDRDTTRLERHLEYYELRKGGNLLKPSPLTSAKHPNGVPYGLLTKRRRRGLKVYVVPRQEGGTNAMEFTDNTPYITEKQYNEGYISPTAVPKLTPILNNNRRVIAYRDSVTNERVSVGYYRKFRKVFTDESDEDTYERVIAFQARQAKTKKEKKFRNLDLADSYLLRQEAVYGIKMTRRQVLNSSEFKQLVYALEAKQEGYRQLTPDSWERLSNAVGDFETFDSIERESERLRIAYGEDIEYQDLLIQLGRRLPSEDRPVGDYPQGYMKDTVIPYYEALLQEREWE